MNERIDIKKYPLTNRLSQLIFKENTDSKSVNIIFSENLKKRLVNNIEICKSYEKNKYIKFIAYNKRDILKKCSELPKKNINFISIKDDNANYLSFASFKKHADKIEHSLNGMLRYLLHIYHTSYRKHKRIADIVYNDEFRIEKMTQEESRISAYTAPRFDIIEDDNNRLLLKATNSSFNKEVTLKPHDERSLNNFYLLSFNAMIDRNSRYAPSLISILLAGIVSSLKTRHNINLLEESKVGKALNKVFDKIKANEIEEIINCYTGFISLSDNDFDCFDIVNGPAISDYYNKNMYVGYTAGRDMWEVHEGSNELHKSCMRFTSCRDQMKIYESNPEAIKLLILRPSDYEKTKSKKIEARCLLWGNKYYDRIYAVNKKAKQRMMSYCDNTLQYKNISNCNKNLDIDELVISVQLSSWDHYNFPYMDSFNKLSQSTGEIFKLMSVRTNEEASKIDDYLKNKGDILSLNGGLDGSSNLTSYSDRRKNIMVKSDYYNKEIAMNRSVYSKLLDSFILLDDAIYIKSVDDFDTKKNIKNYRRCIHIIDNNSFTTSLTPINESIFCEEIDSYVHKDFLMFNEDKLTYELIDPSEKSKNEKV